MSFENQKKVLIVDDTKENIDVLGDVLSEYKRLIALDGEKALKIAFEKKPDIILLDIMMPGIDGFQVIKKLKASKETSHIPVIFVTAKNEIEDEIKGLELGAIDFITKPINPRIVLNRVRTHLELYVSREKLIKQNLELSTTMKKLQETQEQLIMSEKLATLGNLINSIGHEINSPFGAIKSSNEYILANSFSCFENIPSLFNEMPKELLKLLNEFIYRMVTDNKLSTIELRQARKNIISELAGNEFYDNDEITNILLDVGIHSDVKTFYPLFEYDKASEILRNCAILHGFMHNSQIIKIAVEKISKLIYALKNYSRMDHSAEKTLTKLNDCLDMVFILYYNRIKYGIEIIKDYKFDDLIYCYPDELNQVFLNIVHNAFQAMDFKGKLFVKIEKIENDVMVSIKDTGPGIPDNIKEKIFEAYFTTKPPDTGSGMGLDIVNRIVKKHSGRIEVISNPNEGAEFKIFLPIQ